MSSKKFPSLAALVAWLNLDKGDSIEFPFVEKDEQWKVVITAGDEPGVIITSSFFEIRSNSNNWGAPNIFGHLVPFGEEMASGVVTFGLDDTGSPAVVNRRRLTDKDQLGDEETVVGLFIAQPDRCQEPVVVLIRKKEGFLALTEGDWLALYDRVRDAVEREAVVVLRRHLGLVA